LNFYGQSKLDGEKVVLQADPGNNLGPMLWFF
jgi:dTDP-4-dehydrorhamnose reductase